MSQVWAIVEVFEVFGNVGQVILWNFGMKLN
jgi:hypothetical protein